MNPLDFATMEEFRALHKRVIALEAKAKEPWQCVKHHSGGNMGECIECAKEKAKEPEKDEFGGCVRERCLALEHETEDDRYHCYSHHPNKCFTNHYRSTDPPPKPSGWRAREQHVRWFEEGGTVIGKMGSAIEVHPRAVRVRMHRYIDGSQHGPWEQCTQLTPHVAGDGTFESVEHAEFFQVSSEPAAGGK